MPPKSKLWEHFLCNKTLYKTDCTHQNVWCKSCVKSYIQLCCDADKVPSLRVGYKAFEMMLNCSWQVSNVRSESILMLTYLQHYQPLIQSVGNGKNSQCIYKYVVRDICPSPYLTSSTLSYPLLPSQPLLHSVHMYTSSPRANDLYIQ
jgi:hypothetical protein